LQHNEAQQTRRRLHCSHQVSVVDPTANGGRRWKHWRFDYRLHDGVVERSNDVPEERDEHDLSVLSERRVYAVRNAEFDEQHAIPGERHAVPDRFLFGLFEQRVGRGFDGQPPELRRVHQVIVV
jgi:hypothetical protein